MVSFVPDTEQQLVHRGASEIANAGIIETVVTP